MNKYKQQIIDFYDGRDNYDNEFTENRAFSLFKLVSVKQGQHILDVATGTGFIAIEASKKVGNQGKVIGVDFSPKMLERCQIKIDQLGLSNIELINCDVDELAFSHHSFDVIFCSSALVIFTDVIQVLKNWFNWLKPDGYLAFSYYSAASFFTPVIMKICEESGYNLPNFHLILD
jgi:protein-L-isoaspartate(D-aspartate) O-methyltransferase